MLTLFSAGHTVFILSLQVILYLSLQVILYFKFSNTLTPHHTWPKIGTSLFYYSKNPKIPYIKSSDKMAYANSVDPDQNAPEGAV